MRVCKGKGEKWERNGRRWRHGAGAGKEKGGKASQTYMFVHDLKDVLAPQKLVWIQRIVLLLGMLICGGTRPV